MGGMDVGEIAIAALLFAGLLWGLFNWTHSKGHSR